MSEMKIVQLTDSENNEIVPVTSIESVYAGNETLKEYLEKKLQTKADKIIDNVESKIKIFNRPLISGFDSGTGVCAIGVPKITDGTLTLNINGYFKNNYANIQLGLQIINGEWVSTNGGKIINFSSNVEHIYLGEYDTNLFILLGDPTNNWENSIVEVENCVIFTTDTIEEKFSSEIVEDLTVFNNLQTIDLKEV